MKLTLSNGAFDLIEQTVTTIQSTADQGILNPGSAIRYLCEIRSMLFDLRQILRNEIYLEDPESPDDAA